MTKKIVDNIYQDKITFSNLELIWNIVRKTCKNKNKIYDFYKNKNTNLYNIGRLLINKEYIPNKYHLFKIKEKKERLVMSQSVQDKIVNHFVANFYLIPYLDNKLIDSNVATRKNKGGRYAHFLMQKYINGIRLKNPNIEIYVLKLDISKYFYNIDHEILLDMLKKDIKDYDVINIISSIINETDKDYINNTIDFVKNGSDIPYYQKGVGLSIGAMTSQFLAIYYLNDIDHFIKEKLKCKYYIRYMDDFVIIDTDKEKLKKIWHIIDNKLKDIKLKLNPKSNIYKLSRGVNFVGYKYQIINNRFKILYSSKTLKKVINRLNYLKKNDMLLYYRSFASYCGYFIIVRKNYGRFKMSNEEKYDYYKKNNEKKIVFIRDGKFYRTYKNDAMIIWYLFNYKWLDNSICFGDSANYKVFDNLLNKDIGYIVIEQEDIIVNGNDRIYDIYIELSNHQYEKENKKKDLYNIIDSLLNNNDEMYINIKNALKALNNK